MGTEDLDVDLVYYVLLLLLDLVWILHDKQRSGKGEKHCFQL